MLSGRLLCRSNKIILEMITTLRQQAITVMTMSSTLAKTCGRLSKCYVLFVSLTQVLFYTDMESFAENTIALIAFVKVFLICGKYIITTMKICSNFM